MGSAAYCPLLPSQLLISSHYTTAAHHIHSPITVVTVHCSLSTSRRKLVIIRLPHLRPSAFHSYKKSKSFYIIAIVIIITIIVIVVAVTTMVVTVVKVEVIMVVY